MHLKTFIIIGIYAFLTCNFKMLTSFDICVYTAFFPDVVTVFVTLLYVKTPPEVLHNFGCYRRQIWGCNAFRIWNVSWCYKAFGRCNAFCIASWRCIASQRHWCGCNAFECCNANGHRNATRAVDTLSDVAKKAWRSALRRFNAVLADVFPTFQRI